MRKPGQPARNDGPGALACWALSLAGLATGRRLAGLLAQEPWPAPGGTRLGACALRAPARLCALAGANGGAEASPFARFVPALAGNFRAYRAHVIIGAAGIAVRALAPLLRHKSEDPPVVVLDAAGRFAVSLLSGHWGGANGLARHVARLLGGEAVITTASDSVHDAPPALDELAREAGLRILDWEQMPRVAAALLEGEPVPLSDPLSRLPLALAPRFRRGATAASGDVPLVRVHWQLPAPAPGLLRVAAPLLHAGVGCRKGVDAATLEAALREALAHHGLAPAALADLATVREKAAEPGLVEAAARLGVPVLAFAARELAEVAVPNPSAAAGERFGLAPFSVCEGAALLAAREGAGPGSARLLVSKTVHAGRVTVAIALGLPGDEGETA